MDKLVVKKGFTPNVAGKPSKNLKDLRWVSELIIDPNVVPHVVPFLKVSDQDYVKRGDVLFQAEHDKRICFLSPGSGRVTYLMHASDSKPLLHIVLDKDEKDRHFDVSQSIDSLTFDRVRDGLLEGGLWNAFCAYPSKRLPNPDVQPPAIYVSLDDNEPFHPDAEVYLKGRVDDLKLGISLLKKLTEGPVYVASSFGNWRMKSLLSRLVTHEIVGDYPASDPGVFLFHNKGSAYENTSWGIRGEDVLRIARFFKEGRYPDDRVAVLGGSQVKVPIHCRIRQGTRLVDLLKDRLEESESHIILGGMFRGRAVSLTDSFGYLDDAVHVISAEEKHYSFLPFLPGHTFTSYSRGFFSSLFKKSTFLSVKSFGQTQHCIGCDLCSDSCAVDLMPQDLWNRLERGDKKSALKHGLLDCVSCGVCTYVCPSKINLGQAFDTALNEILQESYESC